MEQNRCTLGDLLVSAGAVEALDLPELMSVSTRICVPLGQTLMSEGILDEGKLRVAVDVHSLIMDRVISVEQGSLILRQVFYEGTSLEKAIEQTVPYLSAVRRYRLGTLLVDAQLISEAALAHTLEQSAEKGLPVGHILVSQRTLPAETVDLALQLQGDFRKGVLTFEECVDILKRSAAPVASD